MGKLKAFDIVFDHPQAVYHAGETLQGYIMVDLSEPMKMRNIRILFRGRAKVHWTKTKGSGSSQNTTHYRAEEVYLNHVVILFGTADGDATTHQAGMFRYPFTLQLNSNLPSSFEGQYGYVRYLCKATIDKPWKFAHDCKAAFTVIRKLDLNFEENILSMMQASQSEEVSCCCCFSGNVEARFSINRTGFVPGEGIVINAEVQNKSNAVVPFTKVALKQYTEFYGRSDSMFSSGKLKAEYVTNIVGVISRGTIAAGQNEVWNNTVLRVPPLPPSRLLGCDIINIGYVLKFYVSVPCGPDIKFATDVVIGTIPLRSAWAPQVPSGIITQQPMALHHGGNTSETLPEFLLPPPSYENAVGGAVNIKDDEDSKHIRGNLYWSPAYPTYHLPDAPPGEFASSQI